MIDAAQGRSKPVEPPAPAVEAPPAAPEPSTLERGAAEAVALAAALEAATPADASAPPPMDVPAPPMFAEAVAEGAGEPTTDGVDTAVAAADTGGVAFLVDTSGSMVDSMPQVRRWLAEAIARLGAGQRFNVVKLGSDGPEAAFDAPRNADAAAREAALAWVQKALASPYGRADPLPGLRLAASQGVSRVILLADDTFGGRGASAPAAADLLAAAGPDAAIFAVQFNYPSPDGLLARLGAPGTPGDRPGSGYVFVEPVNDLDPGFDASILLP